MGVLKQGGEMVFSKVEKKQVLNEEAFIKREYELRMKEIEVAVAKKLAETLATANQQINDYEHEFHSTIESRKTEIAKLDALIEDKKK